MGNTINQDVVIWARAQLGKQIGNGECAVFAREALIQAGAKTCDDFTPKNDGVSHDWSDANYVWGDEISDLKDALPGDILQFRNFFVSTTTKTVVTLSRAWSSDGDTANSPHHTAVIFEVCGGGLFKVLEQNVEGVKIVLLNDLYTKNAMFETRTPATIETTTITVRGTIWAYRPIAK